MATEPREFAHRVLGLDRAPPHDASALLGALDGAVETGRIVLGVQAAALTMADEDGVPGVVAMTEQATELRALVSQEPEDGHAAVTVRSYPVLVRCVPVGRLELYETTPGGWAEDRVTAASAYANVVADLLRASLDALGGNAAEPPFRPLPVRLTQLSDLLDEMTDESAPNTVTRLLLERGHRALDALGGVVGRIVAPSKKIELVAWTGDARWAAGGRRSLSLDAPVPLAKAARERTAMWLPAAADLEPAGPGAARIEGWEAQVAVGFGLHGQPTGVLGFAFAETMGFDQETRVFVRILAQQCALAFERDQLFNRVRATRDASRRVQRRAIEVATLTQPYRVLNSEEQSMLLYETTLLTAQPDEQAIMDQFTNLNVPVFADWCVMYVPQPGGMIRRAALATGNALDERQIAQLRHGWQIEMDSGHPIAEVYRSRKPIILRSISAELIDRSMPSPQQADAVRSMGLRSLIFLPLDGEKECLGVVAFISTRSAHYTDADLAFGTALAARVTTALEQVRRRKP